MLQVGESRRPQERAPVALRPFLLLSGEGKRLGLAFRIRRRGTARAANAARIGRCEHDAWGLATFGRSAGGVDPS